MLLAPRGVARERILKALSQSGIEADRVEFVDRTSRRKYLDYYHRIDVGLDTLPYNGHTTSLDAMWMGVPLVTRVGQTVVGRGGWSQLSNLKLTELAGHDDEQFVRIAVDLASDLPRLTELRRALRKQMMSSPLMDPKGFARGMEGAYRAMWREWCDKKERRGLKTED
jgi:predicted O-linked N-acetylglucosamine transferase (SPINDLY family)